MWRNLFLTLFLFSLVAFGQTQEKPKAILQDVIVGRMGDCDLGSRLDSLQMGIIDNPNSSPVIITYQSVNALPANYDSYSLLWTVKTKIKFRQFDESKFKVLFGGFRSELETEFWFVPQGADEPQPTQTLPKPVIPTDKTFLYDKSSFGYECFDCGGLFELLSHSAQKEWLKDEKEAEEENKKHGIETDDTKYEPTFTKEEIEDMKFDWTKSKFGEVLKTQKDSIGTIIFYGDKKEYNIQAVRNHVEEAKRRIIKESQLQPNRIKIVYGGYMESLFAEFWVTPKGATLPKPKPEKREIADSN